jgi:signal transduction histidine kinase
MWPVLAASGWAGAALAAGLALFVLRVRAAGLERVARAMHELRGPITAARLGLQLGVRTGELPPSRLRAIDLELGRAALALDDLPPRRRYPGRSFAVADFDGAELLADAVEASRADAAQRGVALEHSWSDYPARVVGDRLRIAQAVRNLIANAIEHGGGPVEVRGRRDRAGVRIEVIDDGPGLPAPVAELVRRARGGRGARGRGLAIASAIAHQHGGRLAAAPTERGARLVLELPVAVGEAPAPELPGAR